MQSLKSIFVELGMFLVALVLGSLCMGYFLEKANQVNDPMDYLIQCGTGEEWARLSSPEKRELCEEVARRFQTDKPEVTVVYYYLYLEGIFGHPKSRTALISDVFIEAEMQKSAAQQQFQQQSRPKLSTETPDKFI